jgi:hypothetical protein
VGSDVEMPPIVPPLARLWFITKKEVFWIYTSISSTVHEPLTKIGSYCTMVFGFIQAAKVYAHVKARLSLCGISINPITELLAQKNEYPPFLYPFHVQTTLPIVVQ